jgi:hypothetical protein
MLFKSLTFVLFFQMKVIFTVLIVAIFLPCFAQKYDFNWVLGSSKPQGDLLSFGDYELKIYPIDKITPFSNTNTSMSNINGEFAFTFNGIQIQNSNLTLMVGTDSLCVGSISSLFSTFGGALNQASVGLPVANHSNLLRLLYVDLGQYIYTPDSPYVAPYHLYMATIDLQLNNGVGKVIEKNIILLSDTLSNSPISSVKHANGRDWWVVVPEIVSNNYHILLLNEEGLDTSFIAKVGLEWPPYVDLGTQSLFTPDGKKYILFNDYFGLQIFDFDRCSGLLYNPQFISFDFQEGYFSGAAVSFDSRYLYLTDVFRLHQYDLLNDNIASSKILIDTYDGFTNPYQCNFSQC